jgi:hypothetical protein
MIHLVRNVLLFPAFLSLAACAASAPTGTVAAADTARKPAAQANAEDLSRFRPVFTPPKSSVPAAVAASRQPVTPTSHVNPQIEQRLRDQAYTNQNVKYAQGFRILAYVGLERDQAMATRRAIISRYPEETDYLAFKQPVFRLWIGGLPHPPGSRAGHDAHPAPGPESGAAAGPGSAQ